MQCCFERPDGSARQSLVIIIQQLPAEHVFSMWHAQGMPLHVPIKDWACVIKLPFIQERASSTPHHGHRLAQTAAESTKHLKGKHGAQHFHLLVSRGLFYCFRTAAELTTPEVALKNKDSNQLVHEPEAAAEEEEMPQLSVLVFSGGTAFNSVAGKPGVVLQHCAW